MLCTVPGTLQVLLRSVFTSPPVRWLSSSSREGETEAEGNGGNSTASHRSQWSCTEIQGCLTQTTTTALSQGRSRVTCDSPVHVHILASILLSAKKI